MMQRPCRVLLVEDNPADVRLFQEAFKESPEPHELHTALDGEEALDFLYRRHVHKDKLRPDLVLLDINLPKVNGHQVLQAIKAEPGLRRIPVIMLTSSTSFTDVREAYDHHANAYLQKPAEFDDYFDVVREVKRFWLRVVELPAA